MDLTITVLQALLAMLSLEVLKQLAYKIWPTFSLDQKWYLVILPILGLLMLPAASWLHGDPFSFAVWTQDQLRQTAMLVVTTLGSMFGYVSTLRPFKAAVGLK